MPSKPVSSTTSSTTALVSFFLAIFPGLTFAGNLGPFTSSFLTSSAPF